MFNNKIVNIVFSILVAIGLWVYVVGEINPNTTGKFQNVPVRIINSSVLAESGLALKDPGEQYVDVSLTGSRSDMKALTLDQIEVSADLSGLKKGENVVHLSVTLPDNIKLNSISNGTVRVTIEDLVSAEKPIEAKYVGTVPEGEEPGGVVISPETVLVSGAESTVDAVEYVAASVNVEDIGTISKALDATLKPVDKDGKELSYLSLGQDRAQIDVAMLKTKTVPLVVQLTGDLPTGLTLDAKDYPQTITVKGTASELKKINSVTSETIDISNLKDSAKIPIQLNLATGVEVAWSSENPVLTLTISQASAKTLTYSSTDLVLKGLASGYKAKVADLSITLTVKSTTNLPADLSAGDFALSLDLSNLTVGVHQVPIAVQTQLSGVTYTVSPKEINVTISEE